ncbi:tetratricopeptide repeat protein [Thiohalorhabdus sp.]|uniref:tetratricopeptide repeat protein n=1 Tax=Thiohalorhabdus sp. TaxID=3094134 RepID=UPI002FC34935
MRVEVPESWQQQRRAEELAGSGYRALAGERYREAVERLSEARRLVPERTDVANNLALAQWQAGSPEEAIRTLTGGLQEHPANPRMAQNLAHFLLRRDNESVREEGMKVLTRALEEQERLHLYALVGTLYRKMGRPPQAISIYRSGIARHGAHWRLLVGLGLALEADGQKARAAEVYRRVQKELPEGQRSLRKSVEARLEDLPAGSRN